MRDTVRRKWSYFVDYYLLKTVIILAAASLAAFIIIRVVSGGENLCSGAREQIGIYS